MGLTRRYILSSLFRAFDLVLLVLSLVAAAAPTLRRAGATSPADFLSIQMPVRNFVLLLVLVAIWYGLFSLFGLYESRRLLGKSTEARDVLKATSLGTLALFAAGAIFHLSLVQPQLLAVFWLVSTGATVLSRRVLRRVLEQIRLRGLNIRRLLIVGTNARAIKLAEILETQRALGYRIVGFVDREWMGTEELRKTGMRRVCDFEGFASFVRDNVVDEVVITLPMNSFYPEASRIAAICEEQGIITHFLSNLFDLKLAQFKQGPLDIDSLITLNAGAPQSWASLTKRAEDIAISLLCLVTFAPVLVVTAILVKLTSRGPVFFVQKRVGLNKRTISVYKFRTMVTGAEQRIAEVEHLNEMSGPVFKIKNDPRLTKLGKYLRKTSIDELPQFFNVLRGDMSLVGPRAMAVRDFEKFDQDWHRRRFSVRPGITCLWQVNGRNTVPFERWMELDMEYIDQWSLWLDLQILVKTIPAVLRGTGAA